jgi:hypothetical protein
MEGLRDDLNAKAKEVDDLAFKNAELCQDMSEMEDKIKLLNIVADHARHVRVRFLHTGYGGFSNRELIEAGNRAAHDGNLVVDTALFSLGLLQQEEKSFCEDKYAFVQSFSIDQFVGNFKALELLIGSSYLKLANMHASFHAERKWHEAQELEDRFRVLEQDCLAVWEGMSRFTTIGERMKIFDECQEITPRITEMEEILRKYQEARKERDAARRPAPWPGRKTALF